MGGPPDVPLPGGDEIDEHEDTPDVKAQDRGSLIAAVIVVVGVLIVLFTLPARSHEWFNHQKNPVTGVLCCYGGPSGDCQVIEEDAWWQAGDKYFVKWLDGQTYSIPVNQALPSQDKKGKAAACIQHGKFYCFFLPISG